MKALSRNHGEPTMKRPISLTITAAVWFSIGLLGLLNNCWQRHGVELPDSNLVNMVIGVGLWQGWRLCHWLAVFFSTLGFIVMALGMPWVLGHADEMVYVYPMTLLRDQRPHEMMSRFGMLAYLVIGLWVTGWTMMILRRAEVRRFFAAKW